MSVIYVLLSISVCVALVFFVAFLFSVRSGQYDDAYTPSVRMLFEDELVRTSTKNNNQSKLPKGKPARHSLVANFQFRGKPQGIKPFGGANKSQTD